MCDKTFSILKEFRLMLSPGVESEQMFIEDKDDIDMYFSLRILEVGGGSEVSYISPDRSHGKVTVSVHRGWGAKTTDPIRLGTYGDSSVPGNVTGLYMGFDITPVVKDGNVLYSTFVQFKIKGGE